ncbi:MAG TPA: hypothetical protein VHV55_25665 [Pirellulales bacterium]|jgi:hypothetical protein|nr:hypothetical protein [Pirellulales bacterium]
MPQSLKSFAMDLVRGRNSRQHPPELLAQCVVEWRQALDDAVALGNVQNALVAFRVIAKP